MQVKQNQNLLLIGDNYISKVLIGTAKKLSIPIFCDKKFREAAGRSAHDVSALARYASVSRQLAFYVNSEECLEWITENFYGKRIKYAIGLLKDKAEFRRIASSLYPDFYFRRLSSEQLETFDFPEGKVLILKPAKGFFGIGVRKINNKIEWKAGVKEVMAEVKKNSKYFPKSILDNSYFVAEEFIDGEEYAVDMYYDSFNEPVIMNIYHHPYRDKRDTRNVLYYSDANIISRLMPKAIRFFRLLSEHLYLNRMAIHAEFRETKSGKLVPIEVNPCRFGGFGLADLTYYGYGFNPYEHFFAEKKPNWNAILEKKSGLELGWILANNPDIDLSKSEPDHKKFRSTFTKILHYNEMDYKKWPVFATVYAQSRDINEFLKYLHVDFAGYFKKTPR